MEPKLIHPIEITIEQRLLDETLFDEDTREPIRQVARSVVKISAQVSWAEHGSVEADRAGVKVGESGYILARVVDLQRRGVSISAGDRVVKIGALTGEFYITRFKPMGHYGPKGARLIRYYFEDRALTHASTEPIRVP